MYTATKAPYVGQAPPAGSQSGGQSDTVAQVDGQKMYGKQANGTKRNVAMDQIMGVLFTKVIPKTAEIGAQIPSLAMTRPAPGKGSFNSQGDAAILKAANPNMKLEGSETMLPDQYFEQSAPQMGMVTPMSSAGVQPQDFGGAQATLPPLSKSSSKMVS